MQPIFVMSSERSGSNLVRRMLAAHSTVSAPPPPHLWRVLAPLLPSYPPLSQEAGWRALLADALELTQVPGSHLQWKHALTIDEVAPRMRRKNLSGVVGALYESYAAREGRARWACKENDLFRHALRIVDVYPEARFVYLARDGRDVACSVRKVPTHDQHPLFIAEEWRAEQAACLDVLQELTGSGRARLLRYEDLLDRPAEELQALCGFLELEFEPEMLAFHESRESRDDAAKTAFWENLDKPVLSANKGKYRRELSAAEVALFEEVAGDTLELLGYPLEGPPARTPARVRGVRRAWYRLQNKRAKRRQRGTLLEEPGRKERATALRALHERRRVAQPPPWAQRLAY